MGDRHTQTLVATAPDGTEVTYRTAAGYTCAALAPERGGWCLIAKGWSAESVRKRARTRTGGWDFTVVPFKVKDARSEVPGAIAHYFERKRAMGKPTAWQMPMITQVFISGPGSWKGIAPVAATYTTIRTLARAGAEVVACQAYGSAPADFPVTPLLAEASRPLLGGALIGSRTWGDR
jgi:hypothetical protein